MPRLAVLILIHIPPAHADRLRWDKDVANFNTDLHAVGHFFLDVSSGTLTKDREAQIVASFFGVQGPWYTIGSQMSVVIEKAFGRKRLIGCMLEESKLLPTYNRAAELYNRKYNRQRAKWSDELITKLKGRQR